MFAKGRGRWLAVVVSLVVSGGMIYAQNAAPPCCAPEPSPPPSAQGEEPTAAPERVRLSEAELLAASAPVDGRVFDLALPPGVAPEGGLQVNTIWAARALSALFPEITTIGGYRQDPLKWHPNGLAIDVMIPNYHSDEGIELGNQIAGYALANAERWGVLHVIWRQGFYPGDTNSSQAVPGCASTAPSVSQIGTLFSNPVIRISASELNSTCNARVRIAFIPTPGPTPTMWSPIA